MGRNTPTTYDSYVRALVSRLWDYRSARFAGRDDPFDRPFEPGRRPPVFRPESVEHNVLVRPGASPQEIEQVRDALPRERRHRLFGSMKSSQALTQSVFANLKVYGKLALLHEILTDTGRPLLPRQVGDPRVEVELDHPIRYLGEPRPTSVDAFFPGPYTVAFECKLSEPKVGMCSRPRLRPGAPGYDREYCDGSFRRQMGRTERCPLISIGVEYWMHVPRLFNWSPELDRIPCPLCETYQLVRNVIAACARPGRPADPSAGHLVLLYDARNPAFGPGGDGWRAYSAVRQALRDPHLLQLSTWQQVSRVLARDAQMAWLADELRAKYGL